MIKLFSHSSDRFSLIDKEKVSLADQSEIISLYKRMQGRGATIGKGQATILSAYIVFSGTHLHRLRLLTHKRIFNTLMTRLELKWPAPVVQIRMDE
jgi:hypothetical protein